MARVFIPRTMQRLTGNCESVEVDGDTIAEIISALDHRFAGFQQYIVADGRLLPGVAVTVDGNFGTLGLRQRVAKDAEIHFLPAIGGG